MGEPSLYVKDSLDKFNCIDVEKKALLLREPIRLEDPADGWTKECIRTVFLSY